MTASTRTWAALPPAPAIRSRTRARLRATLSLSQEGGDVEIVVTQAELLLLAGGVGEDVHGLRGVEDRRDLIRS